MNYLHFCGGLPRSGSTILMNILQQNPTIFTTGTCALFEILKDKILIKSRYSESFQAMSTEQSDKAMYGLIHGATKGWFEALTDKPIVISKRHGWSELFHLYPNSKFICVVRDLRDIVESFERVNNKLLALHSYSDNNILTPSMHIHEKYKFYFDSVNAFSASLNYEVPRLMEVYKKDPTKVLFLRYEDLTKDPIYMLKKVYKFLNEPYFDHNFSNIEQSSLFEHDHAYFRERTEHKTLPSFRLYQDPERKLNANIHKKAIQENKWFYESFYPEVLNER